MTTTVRSAAAVGILLLLIGVAGCATPDDPVVDEPDTGITLSPPPDGGLPEGADLEAWAETALPENAPGGSSAVVREVGMVSAGAAHAAVVGKDPGAWIVRIACMGDDAAPLAYTLIAGGETVAEGEATCAGSSDAEGAGDTAVEFEGGTEAEFELSSSSDAAFVYEVSPAVELED